MEVCPLADSEGTATPLPQGRPPTAYFVMDKWNLGLKPRPKVLWLNLAVTLFLVTWAGLMWVTPFMAEPGTLVELDGWVGYRDHNETFEDLNPVARAMYRSGDSQCHQRESRTIMLNDNEMPFCARCVAIYTFMAIGMALTTFPRMPFYDRINDLKWQWLLIALIPIGVDGLGQLFGYWESTNLVRFLTGGLCGLVVGIALGFMLREVGGMVSDYQDERRALRAFEAEVERAGRDGGKGPG